MTDRNKTVALGIDLAKGSLGGFSATEAEDKFREQLNTLLGEEKSIRRAFRKNGAAIFSVMEDILDVLITEGLEDQLQDFVDYRNVAHGDKPIFMVDDYHLFPVATTASGVGGSVRRQKLDRSPFSVATSYKSVKIYDELERFLSGKIDWAKAIAKVQRSFNAQIAADINDSLVTGYTALDSTYKVAATWDLAKFNELVQHVEAATDRKAMVAGTRSALQKAAPAYVAYNGQVVEQRNQDGFFKVIDGTTFYELKQSHKPGTDTFALDKFLLVLPESEEKIVKVVTEGESEIVETNVGNNVNADDSVEYLFRKKYGVGVITSTKYGVYIPS